MADTTIISVPIKGMNTDSNSFNFDEQGYRFALNASLEDFDGQSYVLSNTHSNRLATTLPTGYKLIGHKYIIEQNRLLLAIVNDVTNKSEIGEIRDCVFSEPSDKEGIGMCQNCNPPINNENTPLEKTTQVAYCPYEPIINADCLNFNINYPVEIEYKITDCNLNIYLTDNYNERRFMYFNYLNDDISDRLQLKTEFFKIIGYSDNACLQPIYSNELDCNTIKYHPIYERPCVEFVDIVSGGKLKSGVYQYAIAYSDVLGNPLSQYSPANNPVPVFVKPITVNTNYDTNLAIKIKITGLDSTFGYYNLVAIQTIDSVTEFKLIGTFPTYRETYVHTGNELGVINLTASDIFFKRPYYKTAKNVTKANDYLFFTGLKEFGKVNLQPFAETVKLYWETIAIPESVYFDPKNVNKYRTYQRDEVYPFSLVLEANNGEDMCAIHIPGPSREYFTTKYNVNVNEIINNNDVINDVECDPNLRNKRWQIYNLGRVLGTSHQFTINCDEPRTWETGEFSYWESTEKYPNNPTIWGNLCGQNIRFHKFPDSSITHIHDGKDGIKKFEENNIVYPIGVRVDSQSVAAMLKAALDSNAITQEDFDRIKSYRLVRGNRAGNKSIVAKGLLYDMWDYTKGGKQFFYPNYPYNDLRLDPYISNTDDTYDVPDSDYKPYRNAFRPSARYTFHSPDIHFTNPRIGTELKLETVEYGEAEGYFNEAELQAKYKFMSFFAYYLAVGAGVAAAISATGARECKTITTKSDYHINDLPYGNVSQGGYVVVTSPLGSTYTVPPINTTKGTGDATETHNNDTYTTYDSTTGLPTGAIRGDSETITTCKGTQWQEMNKPGLVALLLAQIGGGLGYRVALGLFETKKVLDLIEALIPFKNFAAQYNSIGKYNNYKTVQNDIGNKRREILRSAYLDSQVQIIDENITTSSFSTITVNNLNRESSVYLKTDITKPFPAPSVQDTSRFILSEKGGDYNDLNTRYKSAVSSYYVSIKNYVPDQYNNINKIEYLETSGCSVDIPAYNPTSISDYGVFFGGDTFITRFALKRKMPFFLHTAFKLDDQSDIRYQDLSNVGYPNFYFNSGGTLMENLSGLNIGEILNPGNIPTLLGTPRNRLDVDSKPFFFQKGKIYLYNYGIPYFLVESDVNTDMRYGLDDKENDFFPHRKDLENWLQEKNVPITFDNTYYYNNTFSKQNKESFVCTNPLDFQPNKECKVNHDYRIIYSEQNQNNGSSYDNWRVFKANNYFDFPITNGKLITADGIENDKILVRFENTCSVFSAYNTIQTDETNIQVGTGGIFQSRPQNFALTDLGYIGSQHKSILHTENGHIWTDAKRGEVFLLESSGKGVRELSRAGMKNWFKENLPFTISKDYNILSEDLDNNYKGIGLHMGFDKRFNRMFLTKLDYKSLDPKVQYINKDFYIHEDLPDLVETVTSCPLGYTLQSGVCIKETSVPAVFVGPAIPFTGVNKKAVEYAYLGSCIYTTFNTNGTGVFTAIPSTNPFWINFPTATKVGPLNRSGIWNSLGNDPINIWLDISVRIEVPESKTYYVGVGADNIARIKLGCNTIMQMDDQAMATNHGTNAQIPFTKWHIYPVFLTKGVQYLTVGGLNYGSISTFGAEIYNNTAAEIAAATSYDDLNLVFTTNQLVGRQINTIGWVCTDGCQTPIENPDGTFSCITVQSTATETSTITIPQSRDTKVSLHDPRYFCDKSWTLSYNFDTNSWVSFHSFLPNAYLDKINHFETYIDSGTIWAHGVSNKSYQVYYGKLYPFTIETHTKPELNRSYMTDVQYGLTALRYHNNYDFFENETINFDEAIVYNNKQCSGPLKLIVTDRNDLSSVGTYPRVRNSKIEIKSVNSNGTWAFNDFYDCSTSAYSNVPFFINNCANSNKSLNLKAVTFSKSDLEKSLLRNDNFYVRLSNTIYSNYKLIFKFLKNSKSSDNG